MTAEEALRQYTRTWDRVKRFNDIKYAKNPKRRKLWQRAHDAWLKYLKAVK